MSVESIPNYSTEVKRLYDTGLFDLHTHFGQGAFTDACVSMLHGKNPRWGHLKKNPSQTQVHGHGEDAALFLYADGTAQAVDFIGGAGGPNPQPGWIVDPEARYKGSDWIDPTDHAVDAHACPPAPPTFGYPDENTVGKAFQIRVKQAYTDAGRAFPDPHDQDAFRHFQRFGYSAHEMSAEHAADKHIAELRAQLGV